MSFDDLDSLLGQDTKAKTAVAAPAAKLYMVMVVDDDPSIRQALSFVLKGKYNVKLCASGMEAVAVIDAAVSAVILDIKMPGMDGFATCKKLKEKFPNLPIIFHSAYQDLKDPNVIATEYKPFAYLTKGQDQGPQKLFDTLQRAAHHYESMQKSGDLLAKLQKMKQG